MDYERTFVQASILLTRASLVMGLMSRVCGLGFRVQPLWQLQGLKFQEVMLRTAYIVYPKSLRSLSTNPHSVVEAIMFSKSGLERQNLSKESIPSVFRVRA